MFAAFILFTSPRQNMSENRLQSKQACIFGPGICAFNLKLSAFLETPKAGDGIGIGWECLPFSFSLETSAVINSVDSIVG